MVLNSLGDSASKLWKHGGIGCGGDRRGFPTGTLKSLYENPILLEGSKLAIKSAVIEELSNAFQSWVDSKKDDRANPPDTVNTVVAATIHNHVQKDGFKHDLKQPCPALKGCKPERKIGRTSFSVSTRHARTLISLRSRESNRCGLCGTVNCGNSTLSVRSKSKPPIQQVTVWDRPRYQKYRNSGVPRRLRVVSR